MIDLAELVTLERDRAEAPLEALTAPINPALIACRIVVRMEPQPWQRPATPHAQVSEWELRKLAEALNSSTDPLWDTLNRWREAHNHLVRTVTPQATLDAEALIRSEMCRVLHGRRPDAGSAFAVRARFHMSGNRLAPDIDNLLGVLMESGSGVLYEDDRQVVDLDRVIKVWRSDDPRVEAIFYHCGNFR